MFRAVLRRVLGLLLLVSVTEFCRGQSPETGVAATRSLIAELEAIQATTTRESSVSVSDGRRAGLAKEILDADPYNAIALEEMGRQHAMTYRWFANFDATKQPIGNSVRNRALEEYDLAERYLRDALISDPSGRGALAELVRLYIEESRWENAEEICSASLAVGPDSFAPWLYRGLVAQLQNQSETAMKWFDRAIEAMPLDLSNAFLGPPPFVADSSRFEPDYWDRRDPWKLTSANERLADHYARMAYSDLWYGGQGVHGWNTERGLIVIRYGIPWSEASYLGGYSRFNELAYRDFEFVFEDVTRGGHFTMYSPKASQSSSWKNDYVIQAAEMAISNPELYDPKSFETVELQIGKAVFKADSGASDVYVFVLPHPTDTSGALAGLLGAFLIDSTGAVLDASTRTSALSRADKKRGTLFKLTAGQPIHGIEVEFLSHDRTKAGRIEEDVESAKFAPGELSISDLVIASGIETGARSSLEDGYIVRGDYSVRPATKPIHESGQDLLVYFELYGLRLDEQGSARFHIEAKLERADPRQGVTGLVSRLFSRSDSEPVSVSVDSDSDGPDSARFISLALPPGLTGTFVLSIRVTDLQTGNGVAKRRNVEVRPGNP